MKSNSKHMLYSLYPIAIGLALAVIGMYMSGIVHVSYPKVGIHIVLLGLLISTIACLLYVLALFKHLSDKYE